MASNVEKDWITEAGLRAVVNMGPLGCRCGYVGVPVGHPLHGCGYSERSPALRANMERSAEKMSPIDILCAACADSTDELNTPVMVFEVHGGLTHSDEGSEYPVPSDLWWFGYDCGHHGDAPNEEYERAQAEKYEWHRPSGGVHRTLEYCVAECESLAKQLAAVLPVTA